MANLLYPLFKQTIISGATNANLSSGTVKVVLVDAAVYTYSAAHQFFSSITAGGAVIATATLGTKTVTNGAFGSANPTWTAVTGAQSEYLIMYVDTGTAGTSPLVAFYDTATGLPVTPNGGDINITVNGSGWFAL